MGLHEAAGHHSWASQCNRCGCQLVTNGGKFYSLLSQCNMQQLHFVLGAPDLLLMKEAVSRNEALLIAFGRAYGPSSWLQQFANGLDDSNTNKQIFLGAFSKICDATEDRIKGMHYAKSAYASRLGKWSDAIKANVKNQRKVILARNKEIWQTLKGHYGAERQAMIEELELGIKRRKLLKAKENAAIEKWKSKRYGW